MCLPTWWLTLNLRMVYLLFLILVCIYAIGAVEIECFPYIGSSEYAKIINRIILNLSYSALAACFFEIIIHKITFWQDRRKFRIIIKTMFVELDSACQLLKNMVNPYSFTLCEISKSQFIEIGMEQDLEEQLFSNQKKRECLEEKKEKIKKIVFGLLEYHAYMTSEEVSLLVRLLNCYLIRNPIISINFDIPENERTNVYDNQYEVLQSIFDIQNMVNVFVRNKISR